MRAIRLNWPVLALGILLLSVGCSKKSSTTTTPAPGPTVTPPATSTYYFRFTLDGVTDTINGDDSKSYTSNTNAVLGIISSNDISLTPAMTLRFSLPEWFDTVTESNVLGLAGKTIYFTDTIMAPDVEYQKTSSSNTWYSQSTADTSFNIKVAGIVFSDTAVYQGNRVRNYVITGTCRAWMRQTADTSMPMTGSFKMILTRVAYK